MNPDGTGEVRYRDVAGDIQTGKVIQYRAGRVHLWADRGHIWSGFRVLPIESLLVGDQVGIIAGALDKLPADVLKSALG
jgi:hypothetical protein